MSNQAAICTESNDSVDIASPKGVVWQADVNNPSGTAQETCAVVRGLAARGISIHLALQDSPEASNRAIATPVPVDLDKLTHEKLNVPESVMYYGAVPTKWNLDYYGSARVGRVAFWSDRIPQAWIEPCNALDEIWVPSEFHREAFVACGVAAEKLRVLPRGVDANVFRPGVRALTVPRRRKFNFLAVTSEQDRKGTDLLLTAYLREFHADDDVSLTLKVPRGSENHSYLAAELAFFVEKSLNLDLSNSAELILLEENLPREQMPALYSAADAFVLPTRGEAMGITLLEALACELPVITTRWGAALEFLDDRNSCLIEIEDITPVASTDEFLPGHRWANPSIEHLRKLMRQVFANTDEAKDRARNGRERIRDTRDWSVVLPRWENEFRRLLS